MRFQNALLEALPTAAIGRLLPRLRMQRFGVGEVLFAANDRISSLFFPTAGAVSLVSELASGELIESAMVGRDGVVGGCAALDDGDAMCRAIVQVEGSGYALDAEVA